MKIKLLFNSPEIRLSKTGSFWSGDFMRFRMALNLLMDAADHTDDQWDNSYTFTIDEGTFILLALKHPDVAWAVEKYYYHGD